MCEVYEVTPGGYHAWRRRGESRHAAQDKELLGKIRSIYHSSGKTYGSPRIRDELRDAGIPIGGKRVARIMRENQLVARCARLYRRVPNQHEFVTNIPNRTLEREARAPDRVWVGDVTYLKTRQGWRFLAVIMDKYSRKILSWSLSQRRSVGLTLSALDKAVKSRRPDPGLIFHSDRGGEYLAYPYRERLARLGIVQSTNRPRWMNDNAFMESFFHTFKSEKYHGRKIGTVGSLLKMVMRYISFYNERRRHTSIGTAPALYEARRPNYAV